MAHPPELRFSPSSGPARPFLIRLASFSRRSIARDKITTTADARVSTVDFWIIVPSFARFMTTTTLYLRPFVSPSPLLPPGSGGGSCCSMEMSAASSRLDGKRGRADVNYRIALSIQWFMRITSTVRTAVFRYTCLYCYYSIETIIHPFVEFAVLSPQLFDARNAPALIPLAVKGAKGPAIKRETLLSRTVIIVNWLIVRLCNFEEIFSAYHQERTSQCRVTNIYVVIRDYSAIANYSVTCSFNYARKLQFIYKGGCNACSLQFALTLPMITNYLINVGLIDVCAW